MDTIKTGIQGFDKLWTGLPKGKTIALAAPAGNNAELFSLEFLYRGALAEENGIYISFEKTEAEIIELASVFDWKIKEKLKDKTLRVLTSELFNYEKFLSAIDDEIFATKATRVVLDSVDYLDDFFETPFKLRTGLNDLKKNLSRHDCTSMLIAETWKRAQGVGKEALVADGIIQLHSIEHRGETIQGISIPQMPGLEDASPLYPLETTKKGFRVREAPLIL